MYLLHNMNTSFLTKKEKMPQKNRHLLLFFLQRRSRSQAAASALMLISEKIFLLDKHHG